MSDAESDDALEGLAKLAERDLRLALRFADRIEALPADADETACDLARSYQRMARSYRQSVALAARLRREARTAARQDRSDAHNARVSAVIDRQSVLKAQISPLIWRECEDEDEYEAHYDNLLDLLEAAARRPDFLETPDETHIAVLTQALGLKGAQPAAPAAEEDRDAAEGAPPSSQPLFNGRLAPPMDIPPWVDDTS